MQRSYVSFARPIDPAGRDHSAGPGKLSVAATVLGNALEFYDFITYAFFAVMIGQTFFPAATEVASLLMSVATFGVGFVMRPVGGLVIGAIGDRFGRKPAMLLTIALMAIGTLGLAATPSYQAIGIAAPIIVVLARLVQGFALGGEVGPATAYLLETAPHTRRGTYASWQIASQGVAALVAGTIGVTLSSILSPEDLKSWGWRVPFLVGLAIVPVGLYIRNRLPETLDRGDGHADRKIFTTLLRDHGWILLLAVFVIMCGTISTYVGNYMTTYAMTTLKLPPTTSLSATMIGGMSTAIFALVGGRLADRHGRKLLMILPRFLLLVVAYPAFLLILDQKSAIALFISTAALTGLTAMSAAASVILITECLPRELRSTGLSLVYATGVAVFGGTTQFIVTWLINATGDPLSPAYYLIVSSVIGLVAMALMPETRDTKLLP